MEKMKGKYINLASEVVLDKMVEHNIYATNEEKKLEYINEILDYTANDLSNNERSEVTILILESLNKRIDKLVFGSMN